MKPRPKSVYCCTCICGTDIESEEIETICHECHRVLVLKHWRGEPLEIVDGEENGKKEAA